MANTEQRIMDLIPEELKNKLPGFLQGSALSEVVNKVKNNTPIFTKS